jgi:transcriptional regulator with XRE-family HTH domain
MSNLKALRETKGLTLKELSALVYIDDSVLSKLENGHQSISDKYAIQLADFYDVSIDYLLGRRDRDFFQENREDILKNIKPKEVLLLLKRFATNDLLRINGAIEYILEERSSNNRNLKIKEVNKEENFEK